MDIYSVSIQLVLDAFAKGIGDFAEWATVLSSEFKDKTHEEILADIQHEFNLRNAFKEMSERGLLKRVRASEEA